MMDEFISKYSKEFEITGGQLMEKFIGLSVEQTKSSIALHLEQYIEEALDGIGFRMQVVVEPLPRHGAGLGSQPLEQAVIDALDLLSPGSVEMLRRGVQGLQKGLNHHGSGALAQQIRSGPQERQGESGCHSPIPRPFSGAPGNRPRRLRPDPPQH
jgi:hypothetical protein